MEENVKQKLSNILSEMNGKAGSVAELLSSEQGKRLAESLTDREKKAIIEKFMSMDEKQVKEKLKNTDVSALNNLTADDVRKNLR